MSGDVRGPETKRERGVRVEGLEIDWHSEQEPLKVSPLYFRESKQRSFKLKKKLTFKMKILILLLQIHIVFSVEYKKVKKKKLLHTCCM